MKVGSSQGGKDRLSWNLTMHLSLHGGTGGNRVLVRESNPSLHGGTGETES